MSVLVKNMTMPQDCPMCPMAHWNAFNMISGCEVVPGKKYAIRDPEYANSDHRPAWCPLVDVPPHGRLGDLDEICKEVNRICDEYDAGIVSEMSCLNRLLGAFQNAPTIITAEEGEV